MPRPRTDSPTPAFRHVLTGIEFVLVPGGEHSRRWFTRPAFRRSLLLLSLVEEGRFSLGLFEELLKQFRNDYLTFSAICSCMVLRLTWVWHVGSSIIALWIQLR